MKTDRKRIFIMLSPDLRAEVDRCAGSNRRRSRFVESVLRDYLNKRASEEPGQLAVEPDSSKI